MMTITKSTKVVREGADVELTVVMTFDRKPVRAGRVRATGLSAKVDQVLCAGAPWKGALRPAEEHEVVKLAFVEAERAGA